MSLVGPACNRIDAAPSDVPRNILLVSIDTLRADHIGAYGATDARTPVMNRLSNEGVRFDAAFSPAPLTLPSHSTLMTGSDPDRHGVRHNGIHRLGQEVTTLGERFSNAGFATAAVVGSLVINASSGLDQGFQTYDDDIRSLGDHATAQRSAASVNAAAIDWLDRTTEPFFLFVHYYDPHRPYDPPAPYSEDAKTPYQGEVEYSDAMLGELLSHLDRKGMLEQTLIVVTSDHGESLAEHDELTHGHSIYDATQRVPLILHGPGIPGGSVVHQIARTADIAPTLLARLDLPPLNTIDGTDLAPLWSGDANSERVAYLETLATQYDHGWSPQYGLRTRDLLYIQAPDGQSLRAELYDVGTDPAQHTNLLDATSSTRLDLIDQFERTLAARRSESVTAEDQELDSATLAQLHALGYAIPATPVESSGLDPRIGRKSLALYHEGDALYQAGHPRQAAEKYQAMLAISPDSGEAWISLGAARLNSGQLELAHEATRTGIRKTPTLGSARLQLGVIEMALGRPADAEASFRQAISLDPDAPGAYVRLLKSLIDQNKTEAAIELDRQIDALGWTHEVWLRRIADLWEAEGQTGTALAAYQRVLALAPNSQRDHMHAAIALIRLGRLDEAHDHLARSGDVIRQPKAQKALLASYRDSGHDELARQLLDNVPHGS
jgi:arylsulfatase A-like enzyme/thioredoxin-like negative regulator of GroEL